MSSMADENALDILQSRFPSMDREVLRLVLTDCGGSVDNAVETMLPMQSATIHQGTGTQPNQQMEIPPSNVNIHQKCYCQVPLHEDDDEDPVKGWTCNSCCRMIKEWVNFWCRNGRKCIYGQITSGTYMICSDCYEEKIQSAARVR